MKAWLKKWFPTFFGDRPVAAPKQVGTGSKQTSALSRRSGQDRRQAAGRRAGDESDSHAEGGSVKASSQATSTQRNKPGAKEAEQCADGETREMPEAGKYSGIESEEVLSQSLQARQAEILERVGQTVRASEVQLPHLPSTSMVVMDMAANPSIEIKDMVASISQDPVLSSRLMQMANSVIYGGKEPVESLQEAVMRVGMRALRSQIFSMSMRQVIFRNRQLSAYAEEMWRQSYSVGQICRAIAPIVGMEAEKAFLLGLLHDVGKIALISVLQREAKNGSDITPSLVGKAFMEHHEFAGRAMATKWKLSDEFISVAGQHHDFKSNEDYPRSAAIVCLAHQLDLLLSIGDSSYWKPEHYKQMEFLGLNEDQRFEILNKAYDVFMEATQQDEGVEAA